MSDRPSKDPRAVESPLDDEERRSIIRSIEPGKPSLESSFFVVLGALATILAFLYGIGLL